MYQRPDLILTDEPVSDDDIAICLQAAQQAPSGGNVQPQQYVVVTDVGQKVAVGRWYRAAFDRYEKSLPDASAFRDEAAADLAEHGAARRSNV